eukprot:m.19601 g.19601  ORF g.19601 m.19601 type:complete len:124 (-) comp10932_c0_seq3:3273-3644(-)
MVLLFKDFIPQQTPTSQRVVAVDGAYVHCYITESFDELLKRVNRFVQELDGSVINVETLRFPSTQSVVEAEYQTTQPSSPFPQTNVQVVRVWYNSHKLDRLPEQYSKRYDVETGQSVDPVAAL